MVAGDSLSSGQGRSSKASWTAWARDVEVNPGSSQRSRHPDPSTKVSQGNPFQASGKIDLLSSVPPAPPSSLLDPIPYRQLHRLAQAAVVSVPHLILEIRSTTWEPRPTAAADWVWITPRVAVILPTLRCLGCHGAEVT